MPSGWMGRYSSRQMKRIFGVALVVVLGWVWAPPTALGASPDERYVALFSEIREADGLVAVGNGAAARPLYERALRELEKLAESYPNYNKSAVAFRRDYVARKLASLPESPKGAVAEPRAPGVVPAPDADPVRVLSGTVNQLQAENAVLQARLKEAMEARPAAVDPAELARARERAELLEKEKALLAAELEKARAARPGAAEEAMLDQARRELEATRAKLVEAVGNVALLTRDKEGLERQVEEAKAAAASARGDLGALEAARSKVAALERDLEAARAEARNASAGLEGVRRELAEARAQAARPAPVAAPVAAPAAPAVDGKALEAARGEIASLTSALAEARTRAGALEGEKAALALEKTALEKRLAGSAQPASDNDRIKALEKERDDLMKQLTTANRELYDVKARGQLAQFSTLTNQLHNLRTRLEVFEARKAPYSAEELALMGKPAAKLSEAVAQGKSRKGMKEMPAQAGPLVAEAQRAFAARRLEEAEAKYEQIVAIDRENGVSLANLAAIQIEREKFAEAETNLNRALALDSQDSFALSLMGIMRFRQERFDDALDALGQAVRIDPQNAEAQNYLGITLSQKGQRDAAEAALRKAVQLAPGYGIAHHNLAVVYATQTPPYLELAKFHYSKALSAGHPENPNLERMFRPAN